MKTIVATRNPNLQRDFARDLLRRRDLRLLTVDNTRELLARLRQGADLCFVDRVLADGEGKDAAAAIRNDKKLVNLPVLLMVTPGGPRPDDPRALGFTDVVELPSPPGALTMIIGRWLGVALRDSDRRAARVHVYSGDQLLGASVNLSEMGMLLRMSSARALTAGQTLALRFTPPGQSSEASLRATVVRVDDKSFAPARGVALNFVEPAEGDRDARAPLERYLADLHGGWPFRVEIARAGERATVTLTGRLGEDADTRALESLAGEVDVRLRDLRGVNSDSAQRWRDLVLRAPAVTRWRLHECPVGFVHQANQNPSLLERAEVVSFHAPYACDCGFEDERVTTASEAASAAATRRAPALTCRACNAQMHFDELPDAFFAFAT